MSRGIPNKKLAEGEAPEELSTVDQIAVLATLDNDESAVNPMSRGAADYVSQTQLRIAVLETENENLREENRLMLMRGGDNSNPLAKKFVPPPLLQVEVKGELKQRWVAQSTEPWYYEEQINFHEDSGYDGNIVQRLIGMVHRAVGKSANSADPLRLGTHNTTMVGKQPKVIWEWDKLPKFSPKNKVTLIVKIEGAE